MKPDLEQRYHEILAGVIDDVLRCQSGPIRVPELASAAGFSRFHLARLFHRTTEETLEEFLRRIRLERSAYMLLNTDQSILEISLDSGYRSPEAFLRSFRQAFGVVPSKFRLGTLPKGQSFPESGPIVNRQSAWKLPSPVDLHWNADWVMLDRAGTAYGERTVSIPTRCACVWRALGNYSRLAESWGRLRDAYSADIPPQATFVTIYLDNMWTHPVTTTMRADIGWLCPAGFVPPKGMRRVAIPGGCYIATRFVERTERNDAWSAISGRYCPPRSKRMNYISYDEYDRWPLPFEQVRTRLIVSHGFHHRRFPPIEGNGDRLTPNL